MSEDRSLAGKVALVTGAGPGIGRASALALARDGADVMVVARRAEALTKLAREVADETGRRVLAHPADLSDATQRAGIVEACVRELGRVDTLLNVATIPAPRASIRDMDWDGYLETMAFNVGATMELCARVADHLIEHQRPGSLVNIGTLNSTTMLPKFARYTTSKAAMVVASKTMAKEVGRNGIRVNVVTPGFTTGADLDEMFAEMAKRGGGDAAELSQRAAKNAALERHVDPEDIAEAVLFLLSERGRNVTGTELHVTAGQYIG